MEQPRIPELLVGNRNHVNARCPKTRLTHGITHEAFLPMSLTPLVLEGDSLIGPQDVAHVGADAATEPRRINKLGHTAMPLGIAVEQGHAATISATPRRKSG